jgi:hypothetical protein
MIKLLAIYPGMDQRSEMLYSLKELSKLGVQTVVIAASSMGLHGTGSSLGYEDYKYLKVFRPYRNLHEMFMLNRLHYDEVFEVAKNFAPDIILASQENTMPLAVKLASFLKVPIVLWVESSVLDLARGRIGYKPRLPINIQLAVAGISPTVLAWWNWLYRRCQWIITCNPSDKPYLNYLRTNFEKNVSYIPWPIGLDMDEANRLQTSSKDEYGIYAGSLLKMKNIEEFSFTIPRILNETSTKRFIFIGHGSEEKIIEGLRQRFGNRIFYARDLPKTEVAKLIAKAKYAYTPAKKVGSWQFIGDCWALATPIISTFEGDYITNNENGLITDSNQIGSAVNRLFNDTSFYHKLVTGGLSTANDRHPKNIALKLFSVLKQCLIMKNNKSTNLAKADEDYFS